jgi:aminobenzoyl-glutamate utilization protein B
MYSEAMRRLVLRGVRSLLLSSALLAPAFAAAPPEMKAEAAAEVDANAKLVQVMVDTVFSYAEPGFQEVRTSAYLTGILEKNGFKITRGVAGIPTAWTATWGDGGPLIAMGSDEDDLRGLSQVPGIPTLKPLVPGAPGHGEGHNSGVPLQITAALAIKSVMQKNHLKGRLMLWPGIAEELLGAKAFYVRAGVFKDVDAMVYVHVASAFSTYWGVRGTGMVSVEYTFHGKTAHAAADPWDGRSALDAVEIMDSAWNFRREHLPITQRSHYVITNGGDQPNIVPDLASVWYYFREHDFASVADLYKTGNEIAQAGALATGTTVTHQLLGEAAPMSGNKVLAEAMYQNIQAVGMPKWSAEDQAFAKAVQQNNHLKLQPLADTVAPLSVPGADANFGASDDVGDITWNVPSVMMMFPSNIPNVTIHNKLAAMAMATPIAHKGVVAGAKAVAMTVLDMMTTPELVQSAKQYFTDVQTKDQPYVSMLAPEDQPAIHRNDEVMEKYRPLMEPFYYDSKKYPTYLEQLGIKYPQTQ